MAREIERRVLPHFPLNYLTFKVAVHGQKGQLAPTTFEVANLSLSGMQINQKLGDGHFKKGDRVQGMLNWAGSLLNVEGEIVWSREERFFGIAFSKLSTTGKLQEFFSTPEVVKKMRKVDLEDEYLYAKRDLSLWLRSDSVFELFVWQNRDGSFDRVHMSFLEHILEWSVQSGLQTGKIFSQRDILTPLWQEHEHTFTTDEKINIVTQDTFSDIVKNISPQFLNDSYRSFLHSKLRIDS